MNYCKNVKCETINCNGVIALGHDILIRLKDMNGFTQIGYTYNLPIPIIYG